MSAVTTRRVPSAAAGGASPGRPARSRRARVTVAVLFALPALLLLGALVAYPILYSVVRSFFDAGGHRFVGVDNYHELFTDSATQKALRNTAVWVLVVPALLTGVGLVLAVLTEKVRWATAFKVLIFMPMAISFLAAGITFRLVYDQDPHRGVLNAVAVGVHDTVTDSSAYPGARPSGAKALREDKGHGYRTVQDVRPGRSVTLGLVGIPAAKLPSRARPAMDPAAHHATPGTVDGVVYLDFVPGGGGRPGVVDPKESGLPGVKVELTRDGRTVAHTTTAPDGSFRFSGTAPGSYGVRLPAGNFAQPYGGVTWLGPGLITPAIMAAYLWIWTGFSMVLIGAGLAALPRDTLEAARMDGASEFQIFRKVTVPQLAPVLTVVFVTLVINVMKVFDLVYIIAPGPVQQDANVLALQMWLVSFGGGNNQGLGSAIGVVLLLLVMPAMAFNIRRFRRGRS
ncbi:alpha-glucoside transport system permease protein [Actinacidiphila alni]|uniref:Alpha-glucoside transport system permease protein n=1 Tax=Actinacidiphila alni TaxID=380248 RepID=A0A1I2J365_9ACTN|nr:ABC transporter permease subunit [Actinacidiphila alni]SFF47697.1 alpha-glucoside transport system permease protein [Actinacidiphila alni]